MATILGKLEQVKTSLLVIFTYEDEETAEHNRIDKLLKGQLTELKESKEFEGKLLTVASLRTPTQSFKKLLLVGLGKKKDVTLETLRRAAGIAAKTGREMAPELVIPFLADQFNVERLEDAAQAVSEGIILGNYKFLTYKTQGIEDIKVLKKFTFLVEEKSRFAAAQAGLTRGTILAEATNYARDLVTTPAADMSPETLEREARKLAKKHNLKIRVFQEEELQRRGMNAILSVGKGSAVPPRMIILDYGQSGKQHIVLCGKGVCFDSGGYNLKTQMLELMKDDMGGAAALLGTLDALARLNVKAHVTVIIGAVENLVSGNSYKPGDIVKASNGKTIEVVNTDAEGRVVLADCLSYGSSLKPDILLDVATLTGASLIALGNVAGVLTTNDKLAADLVQVGEETGDRAWRLPLWEDHKEDIKSDLADMKNVGYPMRAGISAGAVFLQEFVAEPSRWAHLDIGGAVFDDRERAYHPKGASGWGVRFLTRFVEKR